MLLVKAPAKINWSLSVLRKREDGFHDIVSLIQGVTLWDTLIFERSEKTEIISNIPIEKETNLVYRAILAFREYTGVKGELKIKLYKEIPIGAGLGGGSSDAAFTLKALNQLFNVGLTEEQLIEIGKNLGSDVPSFFKLPLCYVKGRGDYVKPLRITKSYTLLLVKPSFGVSTKWAYEALGRTSQLTEDWEKIDNSIGQLYENLLDGNLERLRLWNDFEEVVEERYPEIGKIRQRLIELGAKVSLMTGTGSTVFGLFRDKGEAEQASKEFSGYWSRVVQTLSE